MDYELEQEDDALDRSQRQPTASVSITMSETSGRTGAGLDETGLALMQRPNQLKPSGP
jgi:hypothetical protein